MPGHIVRPIRAIGVLIGGGDVPELNAAIKALVYRAAPEEARIGYVYVINVLRRKLAFARHDLAGLKETGGPAWEALRATFAADTHNLQHTLDDAIAVLLA